MADKWRSTWPLRLSSKHNGQLQSVRFHSILRFTNIFASVFVPRHHSYGCGSAESNRRWKLSQPDYGKVNDAAWNCLQRSALESKASLRRRFPAARTVFAHAEPRLVEHFTLVRLGGRTFECVKIRESHGNLAFRFKGLNKSSSIKRLVRDDSLHLLWSNGEVVPTCEPTHRHNNVLRKCWVKSYWLP